MQRTAPPTRAQLYLLVIVHTTFLTSLVSLNVSVGLTPCHLWLFSFCCPLSLFPPDSTRLFFYLNSMIYSCGPLLQVSLYKACFLSDCLLTFTSAFFNFCGSAGGLNCSQSCKSERIWPSFTEKCKTRQCKSKKGKT